MNQNSLTFVYVFINLRVLFFFIDNFIILVKCEMYLGVKSKNCDFRTSMFLD